MQLQKQPEFHKRAYLPPHDCQPNSKSSALIIPPLIRNLLLPLPLHFTFPFPLLSFPPFLFLFFLFLSFVSCIVKVARHTSRSRPQQVNLPEIIARMYGLPRFVPCISRYLAETLKKSLRRWRRVKDIVRHQCGAVHDGETALSRKS